MILSRISVRARLLLLSIGLMVLLGGASAVLGTLIKQNDRRQQALQEQYRRFEVIQQTQQALAEYRHVGAKANNATVIGDNAAKAAADQEFEVAKQELDTQLKHYSDFDADGARVIRSALDELPDLMRSAMQAIFNHHQEEAAPFVAGVQKRTDLIEKTLNDASARARGDAERLLERQHLESARALRVTFWIIGASILVGLVLTLAVIRSIIGPLQSTNHAIRQVNAGHTEIDLPPVGKDEFGDIAFALRQFRDRAERLSKLAYQDPLTGLGNRSFLEEHLARAMPRAAEAKAMLGLLYIDLDNFHAINDRLGHKGGDRYLCEAVARLHRFIPQDALLCRYAGDNFAVVVEDLLDSGPWLEALNRAAGIVLRGMAEPYPVNGEILNMSVSVGIAVYPGDGDTPEQLVTAADAAMYVAKAAGRNNAQFANARSTGHYRRQMAVASDIRRGLENEEFEPFYQPIVDIEAGRVVGAEALLRWRHPDRGILLPGEFIQVAEESGLINRLGEHCLRSAHRQAARWKLEGKASPPLRLAVNLSARQVQEGQILQALRELEARATDLEPAADPLIDFELTESALLDASGNSGETLEAIKSFGYRLGLDDFGTGYSSFTYLQRLPIDKIKIDRQFVATMGSSRQALAIVSAVVALGRTLDLQVIAEGIETAEQSAQLAQLGCRLQQGFLFTKALAAHDFERWVAGYEGSAASARTGAFPAA